MRENISIRKIEDSDREKIKEIAAHHWGDFVLTPSGMYHIENQDGFVIYDGGTLVGFLTFVLNDGCEITSIVSEKEGNGIGTKLIEEMKAYCKNSGIKKLWLATTNDNLNALHFYQKRGFQMTKLLSDEIDEYRKHKHIPEKGNHNIPIRDVIILHLYI